MKKTKNKPKLNLKNINYPYTLSVPIALFQDLDLSFLSCSIVENMQILNILNDKQMLSFINELNKIDNSIIKNLIRELTR